MPKPKKLYAVTYTFAMFAENPQEALDRIRWWVWSNEKDYIVVEENNNFTGPTIEAHQVAALEPADGSV